MLSQDCDGEILRKKKALAFHILFQACLCKRPFNLFHRKNLYLRLANVNRSFGNKTTWDTDFDTLFFRFHNEISQKIFSNGLENKAICTDIMKMKDRDFDLVYLDHKWIENVHEAEIDNECKVYSSNLPSKMWEMYKLLDVNYIS
jgi:hypothetical protein